MQPNKRRRQKKEILGPISNGFHIDRSFTGFFVTTQLRRQLNTFSVWTLNTFEIQQKSEPQLLELHTPHSDENDTKLFCATTNTTTNTCLQRRKLFFSRKLSFGSHRFTQRNRWRLWINSKVHSNSERKNNLLSNFWRRLENTKS